MPLCLVFVSALSAQLEIDACTRSFGQQVSAHDNVALVDWVVGAEKGVQFSKMITTSYNLQDSLAV